MFLSYESRFFVSLLGFPLRPLGSANGNLASHPLSSNPGSREAPLGCTLLLVAGFCVCIGILGGRLGLYVADDRWELTEEGYDTSTEDVPDSEAPDRAAEGPRLGSTLTPRLDDPAP